MSRAKMVAGATILIAGLTLASTGGPASAAAAASPVPLAGSAAPFTAHTAALGYVAGATQLTIQVWLRPQLAAAEGFAAAVSSPGSATFHHYLSPDAYTARFGATAAEASAVGSWLRTEGFTGLGADPQRNYVQATAPVSKIDAAFGVQIKLYQPSAEVNAGPYPLRANDGPLVIPASLAGSVLGVTGLDNAAPILPIQRPGGQPGATTVTPGAGPPTFPCSQYYGQHEATGLPRQFGTTSFPTVICGYTAAQLRAVYGASTASTGQGQTVALVELGLTRDMFLTLQDYAAANHMPAPSAGRYAELSLGNNTCGDPFNVEEQLDVEASYDMAPAADQLVVGGDACNTGFSGLQGLFDADVAVLGGSGSHPLATVASNSWESGDESQAAAMTNIEHAYLLRAAAEGVGMYFAAGDGSGVEAPSSDPFAIGVGGTTLGIGQADNRIFETGWSTGESVDQKGTWVFLGEQGASGGGPSELWQEPGYQKPVVPSALTVAPGNRGGPVRSAPDISADADPFTGFLEGVLVFHKTAPPTYTQFDIGGTSLATPLVAGMVTAAQEGQPVSFGFLNPVLYQLSGTSAFSGTLPLTSNSPALIRGTACDAATCGALLLTTFDDQSPSMSGYTGQVTLPGYDNMTGLGTPNGQQFVADLRQLAG
jgi:subtilase family serine protease